MRQINVNGMNLSSCPFCKGNDLILQEISTINVYGYVVRCRRCRAQSGGAYIGADKYNEMLDSDMSMEELDDIDNDLQCKAIHNWENR